MKPPPEHSRHRDQEETCEERDHREKTREDQELMKFLFKKSMKVESPMCVGQMVAEFVGKNNSKMSAGGLIKRFKEELVPKIERIKNYTSYELAKLYFVASLPVSPKFLKRLLETAHVELDENRKIVRFDGHHESFAGHHRVDEGVKRFNEIKVADQAADNSENENNRFSFSTFAPRALCEEAETTTTPSMDRFFEKLESQIPRFSFDTQLKEGPEREFSYGDDQEMLRFLLKKAKRSKTPLVMNQIWGEYIRELAPDRSNQSVQSRFQMDIAPNIDRMPEFDLETKTLLLFASGTIINERFVKELTENRDVVLDDHFVIYKFTSKSGVKYRGLSEPMSRRESRKRGHPDMKEAVANAAAKYIAECDQEEIARKRQKNLPDVIEYDDEDDEMVDVISLDTPGSSTDSAPSDISSIIAMKILEKKGARASEILTQQIFENLLNMVYSLASSQFSNVKNELKEAVEREKIKKTTVPMPDVYNVIQSSLDSITRKLDESYLSPGPTINAKDVLDDFSVFLTSIDANVFSDLQEKIKESIEDLDSEDQVMSIVDVQQAINFIIFAF